MRAIFGKWLFICMYPRIGRLISLESDRMSGGGCKIYKHVSFFFSFFPDLPNHPTMPVDEREHGPLPTMTGHVMRRDCWK
jgi:hypothetical protein